MPQNLHLGPQLLYFFMVSFIVQRDPRLPWSRVQGVWQRFATKMGPWVWD